MTIRRKLDKLRLLVGQETFCYRINRDVESNDILLNAAAHELYGQYCLSICLQWLATKYGFPVYTAGINPGSHAVFGEDRYPFGTPKDMPLSKAARDAAFEFLEGQFEPQVELVGEMYMRLLCERQRGEFYTPPDVVRRCVDLVGDRLPQIAWDPACGTGNFLSGLIRHARGKLQGERLLEYACTALHGSDIDGRAIELARWCLFLELSRELKAHPEWIPKLRSAFDRNLQVEDALFAQPRFAPPDLMITNPPYISFGSRDQAAMPLSQSKYLRGQFAASAEYKIRMHSIFQELAIKRLAPGGSAILLVPDAFLSGAYYKKLRRFISEHVHVDTLCELPENIFPDAVAGKWCIAHYRKEDVRTVTTLQQVSANGSQRELKVRAEDLIDASDKYRFQVVFRQEDAEVLRLCRKMARLADFASGHTGIRAKKGQRTIISDLRESNWHRKGLISGASIHQHRVQWDGKWLNVDPSNLYGGGFDKAIIERPKILMRQTADRIIAAVDEDNLYHLNNIHSFVPKKNVHSDWLYFLAGLMNSRLWRTIYQLRSRERARALAQIDIEMIESMPMPDADDAMVVRLATLARAGRQAEIDGEVQQLYGISDHLFIESDKFN